MRTTLAFDGLVKTLGTKTSGVFREYKTETLARNWVIPFLL